MPTLRRLCEAPGCGQIAVRASKYCQTHKAKSEARAKLHQRHHDKRRGSSTERGYDRKWRMTRGRYLKHNPKCVECGSTDRLHVDHIVPLKRGGEKHKWSNLQTLCHGCHNAKTARER